MPTLANEQEGWIRHDGRELGLYGIPTALGACLVDLELRNGCKKYAQNSETVSWKWASPSSSYQGFDVVAYRVCKEPEEEHKWIDWDYRDCYKFSLLVDVIFDDGFEQTKKASTYAWRDYKGGGSIVKWRLHNDGSVPVSVLNAAADAAMRGYTPWLGGDNPVGEDKVEVTFLCGVISAAEADLYVWESEGVPEPIVGYKVLEEEMKKEVEYQIPEGYIRSHRKKPDLPDETEIQVITAHRFQNPDKYKFVNTGTVGEYFWNASGCSGEIICYKIVNTDLRNSCAEVGLPNTNPKQAYGDSKLPVGLVSPIFVANVCLAKLNGKLKYGGANYIGTQVVLSTYLHAIQRHLFAFSLGEEFDPVDGVPHLGAVGASIDIILSAKAAGTLIDDRLRCDGQLEAIEALLPIVASLKELHKDKNPKHYYMNEK